MWDKGIIENTPMDKRDIHQIKAWRDSVLDSVLPDYLEYKLNPAMSGLFEYLKWSIQNESKKLW
jgi:hypothetical protein